MRNFLLTLLLFCITATAELGDDPPITDQVIFHVKQGDYNFGNLTLGLFGTIVPKTVENFVELSNMTFGFGYEKSIFHRIIKDFMIQGGDFEHKSGTGGYSIYGKSSFDDENFTLKHDRVGRLSMANAGKNTNGAQFFITTGIPEYLNGHHVVFGQLISGIEVLNQIQDVDTDRNDRPMEQVVIDQVWIERYNQSTWYTQESYLNDSHKTSKYRFFGILIIVLVVSGFVFLGIKFRHEYFRKDLLENIRYSKVT